MTAVSPTPEEAAARASLVNVIAAAHDGVTADEAWAVLNGWDSLVAALRDARREAEAWLTPFDGSGVEWHEKQIGWKYVYQASDFCKLVAAVHEYEVRALQAERERDQARDALAYLFEAYLPTAECNGPRDCSGTTRGCAHCAPDARMDAARAALGGAAEETESHSDFVDSGGDPRPRLYP